MLVATPLNCTDIDSFAAELLRMFRYMSGIGFKINDMNTMGLVLEPLIRRRSRSRCSARSPSSWRPKCRR